MRVNGTLRYPIDQLLTSFDLPRAAGQQMRKYFSERLYSSLNGQDDVSVTDFEDFIASRRQAIEELNGGTYTIRELREMGIPVPKPFSMRKRKKPTSREELLCLYDAILSDVDDTAKNGNILTTHLTSHYNKSRFGKRRPREGDNTQTFQYQMRPIENIWVEYRMTGSEEIRNFLIEHYLHLVKSTAERMHRRLPGEVDVEDLMSAGLFGLMDAIDAFDLGRRVKFETYCSQRIRGAIFDELRAMDWVPRLVRSRTAKLDRVRRGFEMELGRKPTEQELQDRLQVDGREFQKLEKDSHPLETVSLDRKWYETDSGKDIREIDVIQDNRQEDPLSQLQKRDLQLLITNGLSRAERLIIILYYYEEMTMKEIGVTLDLSESRISQMHSSILARLQAQMQYREKELY